MAYGPPCGVLRSQPLGMTKPRPLLEWNENQYLPVGLVRCIGTYYAYLNLLNYYGEI